MSTERTRVRVLDIVEENQEHLTELLGVARGKKFTELLTERDRIGIKTYGESLHTHNGRNAWQDAVEEAADLYMYVTQMCAETVDAVVKRHEANGSDPLMEVSELYGQFDRLLGNTLDTIDALYDVKDTYEQT